MATRIVGIDFGLARLGISVSDETKLIATPLTTLQANKKSSQITAQLLLDYLQKDQTERKYTIAEIVIGIPLMLSGKKGMLADEVMHFVELLKKITSTPITVWDERLTTVQAERSLQGALTRKRRSQVIDSVAALIILQNYLDYLNNKINT